MTTNRRTAATWGVLLILAIFCGILSSVPAIEKPNYLETLARAEPRVMVGIVFQAMMAIAYVAIVVITYPMVQGSSPGGALAYLILRSIGAAFLFVGIVTLLLLLNLSEQYVTSDGASSAHFKITGELLRRGRDGLNHIGMILPWSLGGLFLYGSFLKTELVPRWLSVWGMGGTVLTLVATVLYMLGQIPIVSVPYMALNAPLGLLEIVLAVYLMVRGFRPHPPRGERRWGPSKL